MPAELAELDNPAWSSVKATLEWLASHQIEVFERRGLSLEDGPRSRHKGAAEAWAVAEGIVGDRGWPHWGQLRARGIPGHGGAVMEERLRAAGVTIE